jgi:glycosyltransferase involved in cell wall biosynthesis
MSHDSQQAGRKTCWITWERHQRSRSLAQQLRIPLVELLISGGRLKRYLRNSLTTLSILRRGRYDTVFVQAPSVVLGIIAVMLSAVLKYRVIVDAHNAIIEGAETARQPLRFLYRLLIRNADLVIVTNSMLAERLRQLGGKSGILPDPVPSFRTAVTGHDDRNSVVVISTWAEDEPLGAVLEAAALLPASLSLTVTGRPRGMYADAARRSARVRLSGFVSDAEYVQMLETARVVVDLTTREDCLVCGAYEALALGRPLVVSDSRALRELLKDGAAFAANEPAAIARAIVEVSQSEHEWAARCAARREAYILEWRHAATELLNQVDRDRRLHPSGSIAG